MVYSLNKPGMRAYWVPGRVRGFAHPERLSSKNSKLSGRQTQGMVKGEETQRKLSSEPLALQRRPK